MAGYFDQCACGEYTCVGDTPCRKCLEAEINRLREEIEQHKRDYQCFSQKPQFYTCPKCGNKTDDLACCYYDEEEAGHD